MSAALKAVPARLPNEKRGAFIRRLIMIGLSDEAIRRAVPKANIAKHRRTVSPAPVVPMPSAPRPRPLKVSLEALGRSRVERNASPLGPTATMGQATFAAAKPPPGVVPAGVKPMAMDANLGAFTGGLSTWTENLSWLGMPFLAELAQRAEYRQIVETLAKEMTRRWIKVSASGDEDKSEQIRVIEKALKKYQIRSKFRRLAELDGFFGRAHLYVDNGCTSDRDLLKVPMILDRRTFEPGTLQGFRIVEPAWTYPGNYDSVDPLEEDFYCPRTWYVMGKEIHRTRLLTLVSREVPDLLKPSYQFGGISMTQLARPYIDNWLRTRQSVSDLVHSFSTMILATDMSQIMGDGAGGGTDLFDRIELFNNMRDNRGTMALDKDREELSNVVTPLGTLDHLQAQAQEQMAAVSHIPLIILLGITPSGLNASSDGELQAWAAYVKSMQEHLFDDPLERVIQIIQIDEWGEIDPDITFDYEPLRELSDAEEATARKTDADTDALYVNAGILGPDEIRQKLANEEDSPYAGIDLSGPPPEPPQMEPDPLGGPGGGDPTGGPPDAPGGAPAATPTRASYDGVAPPPDKITHLASAIAARRSKGRTAHDDAAYEHWWNGRPNPEDDIATAVARIADALENRGLGGAAAVVSVAPPDVGGGVEGGVFDAGFEESEHPRGQPENAGEFAKSNGVTGGGGLAGDPKFLALRQEGYTPRAIADKLGVTFSEALEAVESTEKAQKTAARKAASKSSPVTFSGGETATFEAGGEKTEIGPGSVIYHTTDANFQNFADRPTWFTPFKKEAAGYHQQFQNDRGKATTIQAKWLGGKIATVDDTRKAAEQVWPGTPLIYSMFDARVGEYDAKDVRKFLGILDKAGFAGAMIQDYSSKDRNADADTLAVLYPRKSIEVTARSKDVAQDEDLKPVERRSYGNLQIGIETPRGGLRHGVEMPADYGYIMRTEGADGDRVDVFVGPFDPEALPAFIIQQRHPVSGRLDEYKVMIGFQTVDQAASAYDRSFGDGTAPHRRSTIFHTPFDNLRAWLRNHPMPVTQASVDYSQSTDDNERCGICEHFTGPHSCSRVLGAVDAEGWCRLFETRR